MNAEEAAFGAILLVLGIGAAIWGYSSAEDMGLTRIIYQEQYEEYQLIGLIGILLAAVGAGLMVYGFASKDRKAPRPGQQRAIYAPQGQVIYCSKCGNALQPGAIYCPICGCWHKR